MIRYCFSIFLIFLAFTVYSQSSEAVKSIDVYPIRVNHKWGYVKFYPSFVDTLIQPRYDYIGDINLPWNSAQRTSEKDSPFRIFEIDEKVGLLDDRLQELLPNKYNRIRPLSPQYFAVEKDSLFVLIDQNEKEFFDGERYNDIKSDWSDDRLKFFFVKKDNKWGVRKIDGPLLVDCKYIDLKSMAIHGYFLAKTKPNDFSWMLIDDTGAQVLPGSYSDIEIIDPNVIATKRPLSLVFNIYRKKTSETKYVKEIEEYSFVHRVNEALFVASPYSFGSNISTRSKDTVELWNLQEMEKLSSYPITRLGEQFNYKTVPCFYPLDDNYAILEKQAENKESLQQFLIDYSGKVISAAPYDTIFCTKKEGVYFTGRKFARGSDEIWKWGLIAPEKDSICSLDCVYDEILDFENDIAIIYSKRDGYGAVAIRENRGAALECVYANIFKSDKNTLQVKETLDELTVTYKLTDDLAFIEYALYEKMMVFSENVKSQFHEVEASSVLQVDNNSSAEFKKKWNSFSFKYIEGELQLFEKDTLVVNTGIAIKPSSMVEISLGVFAFYHENKRIETPFTKDFFGEKVALISIYNAHENTLNSKFQMIGYRSFRDGYKYTSFLDPDGKMGLVDRNGHQLMKNDKPVRYLFMGDFFANRARVCMDDRLFIDREDNLNKPKKFRIDTKFGFKKEFRVNVSPLKGIDPDRNKDIYSLSTSNNSKWGYIDENGALVLEPTADFVLDFNQRSRVAKILKKNNRTNEIKPSVDFGLIDTAGNTVLNIDYNDIKEYVPFLQIAADSTPTFFFTKRGHQLFVNRTKLRPFFEGLALFSNDENKWGYVDTLGQIAILPKYSLARPFSDGVAMVVDSTGFCSFIDRNGAILFRSTFTAKQWRGIGDFHEGKVWFKRANGWVWGCYNKQGEEIIIPKFHYQIKLNGEEDQTLPYHLAMDFSKGVAAVVAFSSDGKTFASIIDSTGNKIILDQNFKDISRFDEFGLARYTLKNQEGIGLLNSLGEKLTKPVYAKINPFISGYAKVLGINKKWGLINIDGQQLIPCTYHQMGEVSEDLVAVKISQYDDWFYVDLENTVKIRGPFQSVNSFKGGVTLVKYKSQEQFINKNGELIYLKTGKPIFFSEGILGVVKREKSKKKEGIYFYADESGGNIFGRYFSEIAPFKSGIAQVRRVRSVKSGEKQKREFLGAINKRGVMVVPPKFRTLHLQPNGNVIINPQLFFGVASKEGTVLLDPIYDKIDYFKKDNILRVEQGEKIGYAFLKEDEIEWIWELQY